MVIALLGPAFVVVYGFNQPQPEPPPATQPKATAVLPQVPGDTARAQPDRSAAANRLAQLAAPTLVIPAALHSPLAAGDLPSLVLAPRAAPYTLAELVKEVPQAFGPVQAGPLLVRAHLECPPVRRW